MAVFAASDEDVYACSSVGELYRSAIGKNTWKRVHTFDGAHNVFALAVHGERVGMAGEGSRAMAAFYDPIGRETSLTGLEGLQAYRLRFEPDGRAWVCTTSGLYREEEAGWRRVWPR